MSDDDRPVDNRPPFDKFALGLFKILDGPVTYVRENIVEPIQNKRERPKWYHRRYPRVKTIDECVIDDAPCVYEANEQFRRDKQVDSNILKILRQRKVECYHWEGPDANFKCKKVTEEYEAAAVNWFTKYGDIGANGNVIDVYMKQKHRLIWQRRHPDKPIM